MKYPSFEVRMPRETATRKLAKLCQLLDTCSKKNVDIHWYYFDAEQCPVQVMQVWVVGSYARGALTCGDVDIVVQVESRYSVPPATLNKAFLGAIPQVRHYQGTPESNDSGVAFPGAILLWQAGHDWREALAQIKPDPTATRFARPGDAIPLRPEQLKTTWDSLDYVVELLHRKVLQWHFVPLADITPVEEHEQSRAETSALRELHGGTKAEVKLVPYMLGYLRKYGTEPVFPVVGLLGRPVFGRTMFAMGTLWRNLSLDSEDIDTVVVMPYLNARGPNGFWVIQRGENHPARKQDVKVATPRTPRSRQPAHIPG